MMKYDVYKVTIYLPKEEFSFMAINTEDSTEDQLLLALKRRFGVLSANILMTKIDTNKKSKNDLIRTIGVLNKIFLFNERNRWVMRTFTDDSLSLLNYAMNNTQKIICIGSEKLPNKKFIYNCLCTPNPEIMYYDAKDTNGDIDFNSLVNTLKSNDESKKYTYYLIFPSGYSMDELNRNLKYAYSKKLKASSLLLGGNDERSSLYTIKINDTNIHLKGIDYSDK